MLIKRLFSAIIISILCFGGTALANESFKLDNNVTLIYKYIPNVKVVSVQTWMKTGSVNETLAESGISHVLEHMVFKGTKKYGPSDIDQIVESKGGVMNAATSKDYTFYYINIPSYNAETAFDTISEMVFRAKFIPDELEKEKPVIVQEIKRGADSPTSKMWEEFSKVMFAGTPYEREIIGTEASVNSFNHDMLMDYYNRYYHPDNMTLVVVGDISFDEAKKLAVKYFSDKRDVPAGEKYSKPQLTVLDKPVEKDIYRDINQEYGIFAYPATGLLNTDLYALEVLGEILSGGEFSVLNQKFRYEKNIVNSINGGYYGLKYTGTFLFTYNAPLGKGDEIKAEVLDVVKNMDSYLTDENIEKAKNRLKAQSVFQHEKTSSEANDIGYSYTVGVPDYYDNFLENISKVDKLSIESCINKIFSSNYLWMRTLPGEKK